MAGLLENLAYRARMLRRVRAFFDEAGFLEVETPVRILAPAPEPHIDCLPSGEAFLRASPELQMKKLLSWGGERIYQIGPCFRAGETGRKHAPEFTMLEWYRRQADYLQIAEDMRQLLAVVAKELQAVCPAARVLAASPQWVHVREAYQRWAGWDPWSEWNQDRFDYDMAVKIEPALPQGSPVFLLDYPPQAAALARVRAGVAERWELYVNGLELANCFTELCDSEEQRQRFVAARKLRLELGESDYPLDEEFLSLLMCLESAAGVALGIDRLAMLVTGASDIAEVRCGW